MDGTASRVGAACRRRRDVDRAAARDHSTQPQPSSSLLWPLAPFGPAPLYLNPDRHPTSALHKNRLQPVT
jgi:hypothetical protein